jgi:hypothetical protein
MKESSKYTYHLRLWQKMFGKKNVLILIFDDLKKDPKNYANQVCEFIGAGHINLVGVLPKKPAKEMLPWNRHVARLGEYIGHLMRFHRMYAILNIAKALGLRKIFFEGGGDLQIFQSEIEIKFREKFRTEIEELEELIQRDLSNWKNKPYSPSS